MVFNSSYTAQEVRNWPSEKKKEAVESSEWNSLPMKLYPGLDVNEFAEQLMLSPDAWKAAFEFISKTDFNGIASGKYTLTDDGVYAVVSDYQTKDTAMFEAHRRYVDIQFVPEGEEMIFVGDVVKKIPVVEYDDKSDIEFFRLEDSAAFKADKGMLFVLFPKDAHMPCISTGEKSFVRKIVVKVPYVK